MIMLEKLVQFEWVCFDSKKSEDGFGDCKRIIKFCEKIIIICERNEWFFFFKKLYAYQT